MILSLNKVNTVEYGTNYILSLQSCSYYLGPSFGGGAKVIPTRRKIYWLLLDKLPPEALKRIKKNDL